MLDKFDKNTNPFKVPENYFEGLTKDIMNSLPEKEKKVAKKIVLWKKVLPWTGVAAAVALIAITATTFGKMPNAIVQDSDKQETVTEKRLAYKEAEDYLLFLQDENEEAMYIDALFEEEL